LSVGFSDLKFVPSFHLILVTTDNLEEHAAFKKKKMKKAISDLFNEIE
jgi:hypothetical protein